MANKNFYRKMLNTQKNQSDYIGSLVDVEKKATNSTKKIGTKETYEKVIANGANGIIQAIVKRRNNLK